MNFLLYFCSITLAFYLTIISPLNAMIAGDLLSRIEVNDEFTSQETYSLERLTDNPRFCTFTLTIDKTTGNEIYSGITGRIAINDFNNEKIRLESKILWDRAAKCCWVQLKRLFYDPQQ